jgi:sulfate/thiosulfate transport system substrate-binding protein
MRIDLINWRLLAQRAVFIVLFGALGLFMIWPWLVRAQDTTPRTIIVYGFSILGEMMNEAVFPAFSTEWEARTGDPVDFIAAFAGSGTITNQAILGVPAEVIILSLELDAWRLVENGVLPGPTWLDLPHKGVLNRTPFIILVRPGNPKAISGFADLTKPGIGVVHPDPLTSGGAQWALLAEYGSVTETGGTEQEAYDQLLGIWRNVVAQAASARAVRTQFESGFGDALITYEQEAIIDRLLGRLDADIVYPDSTVSSEHIVAVIEKNINPDQRDLVDAFVEFLWSETAQQIYVDYGFRSVDESLNEDVDYFGEIETPFTVADLGGWLEAKRTIVDEIWRERVLEELGQ